MTNRFDQLFDDEEDPFEVLKQAETKKKDAAAPGAAKTAAQAAKQPRKESQKDRKVSAVEKKEETTTPVPLKKEGENFALEVFLYFLLWVALSPETQREHAMRFYLLHAPIHNQTTMMYSPAFKLLIELNLLFIFVIYDASTRTCC